MKTTSRLLALLLALMVVVGLMVVPATAAQNAPDQVNDLHGCGGTWVTKTLHIIQTNYRTVGQCAYYSYKHDHCYHYEGPCKLCNKCGEYYFTGGYGGEWCCYYDKFYNP